MSIIKEIKSRKSEKAKDLISKGANLHETEPSSNRNLLHVCVDNEDHEILEELLRPEYGLQAETQARDRFGEVNSKDAFIVGYQKLGLEVVLLDPVIRRIL